jgi:hypothetical protein
MIRVTDYFIQRSLWRGCPAIMTQHNYIDAKHAACFSVTLNGVCKNVQTGNLSFQFSPTIFPRTAFARTGVIPGSLNSDRGRRSWLHGARVYINECIDLIYYINVKI